MLKFSYFLLKNGKEGICSKTENRELSEVLKNEKLLCDEAERELIAESKIPGKWLSLSSDEFWKCVDKIWARAEEIKRRKNVDKE